MPKTKKPKTKPLSIDDLCFLCYGPFCYGWGNTPDEALEAAARNAPFMMRSGGRLKSYQLLLVHKDTNIDDMGAISFPKHCPPRTVGTRGKQGKLVPGIPDLETLPKREKAKA